MLMYMISIEIIELEKFERIEEQIEYINIRQ